MLFPAQQGTDLFQLANLVVHRRLLFRHQYCALFAIDAVAAQGIEHFSNLTQGKPQRLELAHHGDSFHRLFRVVPVIIATPFHFLEQAGLFVIAQGMAVHAGALFQFCDLHGRLSICC